MINKILTNKITTEISEVWTDVLDLLGRAWWVEVLTTQPRCTYYFGPFADANQAQVAIVGYVEDLEGESAQGIRSQIKRCKPDQLTVCYEQGCTNESEECDRA
jgi:Domain of unknown function (DUF1816)